MFTKEEKLAFLYAIRALADCDGKRTDGELDVLVSQSKIAGINMFELSSYLNESTSLGAEKVCSIVSNMSVSNKGIVLNGLNAILVADGTPNPIEMETFNNMKMAMCLS